MTLGEVIDFVITYVNIKESQNNKPKNKANGREEPRKTTSKKFSYGRA